ncbi:MAG: hypothetical protein NTX05_00765 [Fusobacteria bacterium]|nr:hypothetical protein [Fusobacteriota bacterium]
MVLSALRGCEVVSDATNVLTLHLVNRYKNSIEKEKEESAYTLHRVLRTQKFYCEKPPQHFKLAHIVALGKSKKFLEEEIYTQISLLTGYIKKIAKNGEISVNFWLLNTTFGRAIGEIVSKIDKSIMVEIDTESQSGGEYYSGIRFLIGVAVNDQIDFVADGGIVNWRSKFLGNNKI